MIPPSGKQEIEFSQFSLNSLGASKANLDSFLLLVDKEQLEAARAQVSARMAFLKPAAPSPAVISTQAAEEEATPEQAVGEPLLEEQAAVAAEATVASGAEEN